MIPGVLRDTWNTLPDLVRFYIRHALIGYLIAAILTVLIIAFDFAGIGHLVRTVEGGWLAAFMLFFFNGIVFSGAQTAYAVLTMAED